MILRCLICRSISESRFKGGVVIRGLSGREYFLCDTCQHRILICSPEDYFYHQAQKALKQLWFSSASGAVSGKERVARYC